MNNKKIIIILSVTVLISGIFLSLFCFNNKKVKQDIVNTIGKTENYKTYNDDKYNLTLNYPSNLIYKIEDDKKELLSDDLIKASKNKENYKTIDRVINFGLYNNGPWSISININKNTKYKNIEDWLMDYVENQLDSTKIIRETDINIDNTKAIVTHMAGLDEKKEYVYEDYPYEKTIAFIKNSNLFIINIKENIGNESYIDFLKSFKFTE